MSTRESIVWGKEVHLYRDMMDEPEHQYDVYLELRNADRSDIRTIRIPAYIWEVIRHQGAVSFDLADQTDEELLEMINAEVDERIANYQDTKTEQSKELSNFAVSGIFGAAEDSKEAQVKEAFQYYANQRRIQREIRAKMKELNTIETYREQNKNDPQ